MLNQITTNFDDVDDDEKRSSWEILVVLRWGERKWLELNDVSALGFSQGRCFRSIHNRVSHRNWRYLKQSLSWVILYFTSGDQPPSLNWNKFEEFWMSLNEFSVKQCCSILWFLGLYIIIFLHSIFVRHKMPWVQRYIKEKRDTPFSSAVLL